MKNKIILALLLLVPKLAFGIDVQMIIVDSPLVLSESEALQAFDIARRKAEEVGISFKLIKVSHLPEARPQFVTNPALVYDRFLGNYFAAKAAHLIVRPRRRLTLFIMGPLISDGHYWLGGAARQQCSIGTVPSQAFILATKTSAEGKDRIVASGLEAAHEMGHMIGAQHFAASANMMHPEAGQFYDTYGESLPWSETSRLEIKKCLKKRGVK